MKWTHHEVGKVDITRMAPTLEAARECGFAISFRRDPSTTTPTASTGATAMLPLPVEDEALDVERGHTRAADAVGMRREAGSLRTARVVTGHTLSATGTARCNSSAGNGRGQRGASGSLPRPEGVLHGGNRTHGVAEPSGLASHPETRDCGARLSASTPGCHGREVRGGGEEGVSEIAASIPAKPGGVVGASAFSAPVSRTLQNPRDRTAVSKVGGGVLRSMEGGELSVMNPTHAEPFPAAAEGEGEKGVVDISASSEGSPSPPFCRVVVVGAGASGLSAAACLRARGEAGVLILER